MEIDLSEGPFSWNSYKRLMKDFEKFGSKIDLKPGNIYFLNGSFWLDPVLLDAEPKRSTVSMKECFFEQFSSQDNKLWPFLFLGSFRVEAMEYEKRWPGIMETKFPDKICILKFLFMNKVFSVSASLIFSQWVMDDCFARIKEVLIDKYYAPELLEGNFSKENEILCYEDLRRLANKPSSSIEEKNRIWLYK